MPARVDPFAGLASPGEWARVGIFLINRRTGERKLAPKFQGAEPGLAKPAPEQGTLGRLADAVVGAAITPGVPGLLTSPGVAPRFADAVAAGGATPGLAYEAARDGIDKLKAKAAEVARNVREAEIQRDGVSAQDLARAKKTTTQVFGKPAAPTPRLPAAMQQVAKLPAESRDAYLEGLAAQGASPLAAALADTAVEGAAVVADPTNALPGAGALKASSLLDGSLFAAARQKAAQEGLETAGERAVRKALGGTEIAPPAGVVTPSLAERLGIPAAIYPSPRAMYGPEAAPGLVNLLPVAIPRLPAAGAPRPGRVKLTEPLPLPVIDPALKAEDIAEGWGALSQRYPRIASQITEIRAMTPTESRRALAMAGKEDVLYLRPGERLTPELIAHELTHVAQGARGKLDQPLSRARIKSAEAPAVRAEKAYRGIEPAGPPPQDLSRLSTPELRSIAQEEGSGVEARYRRKIATRLLESRPPEFAIERIETAPGEWRYSIGDKGVLEVRAGADGYLVKGSRLSGERGDGAMLVALHREAAKDLGPRRGHLAGDLQAQSLALGESLDDDALREVLGGVRVAEASPDLGITRLDPGEKLYVYKNDAGKDVGSLVARADEDGFRVRHVFVDEASRGQAIPERLYRQAAEDLGPYRGSTDYLGRRTPAGEAMASRLRQTAPEIFPEEAIDDAARNREVLAGGRVEAPAAAPDRGGAPVRNGPPAPRNAEAGFIQVPEVARSLSRWLTENFEGGGPSQGMFNAAAMDFPRGSVQAEFTQGVPRKIEAMQGRYNVAMRRMQDITADFSAEVKKIAPSKVGRQALYRDMHLAATGQIPLTNLPAPAQQFVREARDLVGELTDRGIATGAFPNEILPTIQASRDTYLHRTYAAHREKGWLAQKKNTPDWYAALNGLQQQMPGATQDEVIGVLQKMADKEHGPQVVLNYAGPPTRKNAILRKRNNLPPEVRKFLGEDEDFRVSFEKTVHNLAWDIESFNLWKEIGDDGRAAGVFSDKPVGDLYGEVSGSNSVSGMTSKSPLAGDFSTPAMVKALANEMELAKVGPWQRLAGYVKSAKVSQSIQSLNRNFLANPAAIVANGQGRALVDPTQWGKVKQAMASPSQMRRAIELGIRENGAMAGEMLEYIRFIEGGGKVSKAFRSVAKLGQKYQQWGDDFWRTIAWLKESEDLAWAKGISLPEAEELAADRVKDTFQTYSRLNRMSRRLARNPIVGSPGVSFAFESARNVKNIAKIGALDLAEGIRTGNPRMVYLGMRRYVGLTAAAMLPIAAQKASMAALGMRKDQEEAFRSQVAPDYARNTTMLFTEFEPGKEVGYVDVGWMDPYSAIRKPLVASWRSINEGAPAPEVAYEVLNSIAGGDILAETTLEVAFGQRMRSLWPPKMGGELAPTDSPPGKTVGSRAYRAYQGLAPGYVVTGEKLARGAGMLPSTTASGQRYTLKGEMAGLAGFRFTMMDIQSAYRGRAASFSGRNRAIRSELRNEGATKGPVRAAANYLYGWERIYGDVSKTVSAFRLLGMTDEQIGEAGVKAGVPSSMIEAALSGYPIPPEPSIGADEEIEERLAQEVFNAYSRKYGGVR